MSIEQVNTGLVSAPLSQVMGSSHLTSFCDSLKILSNPHRLRIMLSLQGGEASVGDLESGLQLKQPNLSHELRKLRDKGMVKTRRQSKVIFYSIADQKTASLIQDISLLVFGAHKSDNNRWKQLAHTGPTSFSESRNHGECGQFAFVHQP